MTRKKTAAEQYKAMRAKRLKNRTEIDDVRAALRTAMYEADPDPVAARNLIEYFHDKFKSEEMFPQASLRPHEQEFLNYVSEAFARVVEKKASLDVAFGLSRARGKYAREDNTARDITAAAYMVLLAQKGWPMREARGMAANLLFGDEKGEKAVEAAYTKHGEGLVTLPVDVLKSLLPKETPPIKTYKP